ncbi:hypothetical protein GCM10022408_13920 [Hymenobacter fastidiosus]|uniref:Transposase Tn5-like N-terminal domain-containing protein n=1 Tax=Hymenobacter fastidiosus TaxID=486264 RepID=A0ABP7RX33_9BACT
MRISTHFGDPQQWAHTHFAGVALGDVRRSRWVVQLAAGWAREPGASIPCLSQGQAYASKAAYHLPGQAQTTPDALQNPPRQLVAQQLPAPGTYLLVEDTSELSWPEAAGRRPGLGPVGPGKATSQGGGCTRWWPPAGPRRTPTRPPNGPPCRCWAC